MPIRASLFLNIYHKNKDLSGCQSLRSLFYVQNVELSLYCQISLTKQYCFNPIPFSTIFADSPELNGLLVVSDEAEEYDPVRFYLTEAWASLKTDEYLIKEDKSLKTL